MQSVVQNIITTIQKQEKWNLTFEKGMADAAMEIFYFEQKHCGIQFQRSLLPAFNVEFFIYIE